MKTIEIICKPCPKCALLKEKIQNILSCLQQKYNVKIVYELKHNPDLRAAEMLGYPANQTPVVLIDGHVEFAGNVKEEHLIRMKLETALRGL